MDSPLGSSVVGQPSVVGQLVDAVRAALAAAADPAKAPGMRAYMKSEMPFLGVQKGPRERALRPVFAEHPLATAGQWEAAALRLWRQAGFREERYGAIALTGHRPYRAFWTPDALPLYQEMISTGAWWDYVDELASRRIGPLLATSPAAVRPVMLRWSRNQDRWLRRTSIICQLGAKQDTDLDLLYACIEANLDDRDFFLRKAIGWALRAYAWTDPDEVRRYVAAHADRLSPLSRREALRNVGP
ncbi:DNA alkylation repair protein [Frankia sp. CNm7]|uniref:DNA alkylation repair protein n=1 Tax=Frankia nepalensis TaxID=1836974 RepID=A0A937UQY7_9ACTN|nr:DNA alkylation repair protein [Frankia nepalensis]MBL7501658.1 DNA alkylation repair protein [Frankia nepalensis]MBL7512584.1 DNA alkylation repair protein [Frankia nepalensis]MBL7521421.1 DNA alkylation repair protein [Frankia nepalensis]MBL7627211.1 DNA alkylation repair protein [Frankia nepalensis]